MNAPANDILAVTSACLEVLRELVPGERRRVLSALRAVLDLTEEPARGFVSPRFVEPEKDNGGFESPHFSCPPEDVPESATSPLIERWTKAANGQKEKPAKRAPKGRAMRRTSKEVDAMCLHFAKTEGGTGATAISLQTGVGRMTAQKALRRLLDNGLVRKTGSGRTARYHATSFATSSDSSTTR